jgi:hypothetical protein
LRCWTDLFTSGASLEFLLIAWLVFPGLVDYVWWTVLVREGEWWWR